VCLSAARFAGLLLGLCAPFAAAVGEPESYRVEPQLSSLDFVVTHLGLIRQHGRFGKTEGVIVIDSEQHSGQIELSIDASTIDTGWELRDAWLRGEDMFDVARYPVMHFRSTHLAFAQDRLVGVTGLLTLHGATHPITLRIDRLQCANDADTGRRGCEAIATSTIHRSQFGLTYALGWVGDDVDLSFQVAAIRAP
jgi:polyisoprenoid-binding protein YceI